MRKSFLCIALCLALLLSMSTTAFAAGSSDIKVTYSKDAAKVVKSVDITWGSMEFNYNSGDTKVWNPDKLQYEIVTGDGGGYWEPARAEGDTVTVTNHCNSQLEVTVAYTPAETNGVTGSVTNGSFTLASAEGTDVNNAPKNSSKLTLDNSSTPAQWATDGATTIGNITVSLKTFFQMDATNSTAKELEKALLNALNAGITDARVTLATDAAGEMFAAINNALNSSGAAESSIDLTIAGVQVIPSGALGDGDKADPVALKTLNLPDAVKLEMNALALPNVQTVYAPKVTEWTIWGIWCASHITTIVLTAPGDITADFLELNTKNINLTLNKDKESEVDGNRWKDQTWNSISFAD